jgi:hypothetical protein
MWHRWEDNIKMVFKAAGRWGADCTQIARKRDGLFSMGLNKQSIRTSADE